MRLTSLDGSSTMAAPACMGVLRVLKKKTQTNQEAEHQLRRWRTLGISVVLLVVVMLGVWVLVSRRFWLAFLICPYYPVVGTTSRKGATSF